jgi:hypothetical protein
LIEGKENNNLSNLTSAPHACASSPENLDDASTRPSPDELLRVPSNLIPSLKKITFAYCCDLEFQGNKEGFSGFTSLEDLTILDCSDLMWSLVHEDEDSGRAEGRWLLPCSLEGLTITYAFVKALHPCFPGDVTHLTELELLDTDELKSLQLCSCTALEELRIKDCKSLDTLEGFQFLCGLRVLEISGLPGLKSLQLHPCTALEELRIKFCISVDTLEGFQFLRGLRILEISELPGLKSLQLHSCTALEVLRIKFFKSLDALEGIQSLSHLLLLEVSGCFDLLDLPVDLHSLPSLKRLEIIYCQRISRLPERGLPPSLEELVVNMCSKELTEQCRMLATSKLKV